ncbi:hypothetical protein [Sulfitobacter sp. S190]|uniref:hypothetical protein n=1 Tax=Sulfitobacter sp. S190 TaxID=2867022 RepID=UPI0021A64E91|nr:hypothetical protein [Sulfitobacter sp. S190]UWR23110.1 hypothetical protein K3756_03695 [Sulfitobacter sp. S190]
MADETETYDIAREVMNGTRDALMCDNFDAFVRYFRLPQHMETIEGKRLVETKADLRQVFDAVRQYFVRTGITGLDRELIRAEQKAPHLIEYLYETQMISENTLFALPYPTFSMLCKTPDGWQIYYTMYGMMNADQHHAALID